MTDDWTPSTEQVRSHYVFDQTDHWDAERGEAFDRWLAEYTAAKRAEWEAEFLQNATVRVEHRDFDTGPYSDPEPQARRVIKTRWLPVPDRDTPESED